MAVNTRLAGGPRNIGADTTLDMRTGAAIGPDGRPGEPDYHVDSSGVTAASGVANNRRMEPAVAVVRLAASWLLSWNMVPLGSRFNVSLVVSLFASALVALLLAIWLVWSPSQRRVTLSCRAEVTS